MVKEVCLTVYFNFPCLKVFDCSQAPRKSSSEPTGKIRKWPDLGASRLGAGVGLDVSVPEEVEFQLALLLKLSRAASFRTHPTQLPAHHASLHTSVRNPVFAQHLLNQILFFFFRVPF